MNKKYYLKKLSFSLIIGVISIYSSIKNPIPDYRQYLFITYLICDVFLYPIAKHGLESFFSYITPQFIKKIPTRYSQPFIRPRDYFCDAISFLLAIPVAISYLAFTLFKKNKNHR